MDCHRTNAEGPMTIRSAAVGLSGTRLRQFDDPNLPGEIFWCGTIPKAEILNAIAGPRRRPGCNRPPSNFN
jgi:hypothetical protein